MVSRHLAIFLLLLLCFTPTESKGRRGGGGRRVGGRGGGGSWSGEWDWSWWQVWAVVIGAMVGLAGFCGCSKGAKGSGLGVGLACLCATGLWLPFFILSALFNRERCELCSRKVNGGGGGDGHRAKCLARNMETYQTIPDSSLYSCTTCKAPLKLWPPDKLSKAKCSKCEEELDSQVHLCFTCPKTMSDRHYLCGKHHQGANRVEVDFKKLEELGAQMYGLTSDLAKDGGQDQPHMVGQGNLAHNTNTPGSQPPPYDRMYPIGLNVNAANPSLPATTNHMPYTSQPWPRTVEARPPANRPTTGRPTTNSAYIPPPDYD